MNSYDIETLKKLSFILRDYKKRDLTLDEIYFLYFRCGAFADRDKILRTRNKREDLARFFNCKPCEIGLKKEDLYNGQLVFYDNSNIYNNMYIDIMKMGYKLPKYTGMGVMLPYIKNPEGLELPEVVTTTLALPGLKSVEGLKFPRKCGHVDLSGLQDGTGLVLDDNIRSYNLSNLKTLVGVTLPNTRLKLRYHDYEYTLLGAKEQQQYELDNYDMIMNQKQKKYGERISWYYKRG